jgi:two-component system, OmpR family, osmolarity sensor histidine kinase EnvZ
MSAHPPSTLGGPLLAAQKASSPATSTVTGADFQPTQPRASAPQRSPTQSAAAASGLAALETIPAPLDARPGAQPKVRLNLFWRTFILLALLLIGSVVAWLQTFRVLESEPRAVQTAQQIASIVNLSRSALVHADAIARVSLIKQLAELEGVKVLTRKPEDKVEGFGNNPQMQRVLVELRTRLGERATLARKVNGDEGLWVGFALDHESFWIQTDLARFTPVPGSAWLIWLGIAALLSLAGAAVIARLINRPLKQLSFAASRVRDGDFDASRLDEDAVTSEIREVNAGFNRMAEQLAKIEQDRAIMLAGISHDLRTPLARLRLETEMSVADETARNHMVADLEQLDGIIDKFLDYARPTDQDHMRPVALNDVIDACVLSVAQSDDLKFKIDLPRDFFVMGDEVELGRVLTNLIENARKYGKTAGRDYTELDIAAREREGWVLIKVRDHGNGVDPEMLKHLTKPFFRGDLARTSATGAGLGLAIVDKTLQRMGGQFSLTNSSTGGLAATLKLQAASTKLQTQAGGAARQSMASGSTR